MHEGKDPAASASSAGGGSTTFSTLATRYLEEHAKKKNKSWKQADTLVTRYALPHWRDRDASTITRADVRAVLAKVDAPILANQILASTSAIFTWAVKQDVLPHSPCKGIERNATRKRKRVLSAPEVPLFWRAFCEAGREGEKPRSWL